MNDHLITTEAVAARRVFHSITWGVSESSENGESKQEVILPDKRGLKCHLSPQEALRMLSLQKKQGCDGDRRESSIILV